MGKVKHIFSMGHILILGVFPPLISRTSTYGISIFSVVGKRVVRES